MFSIGATFALGSETTALDEAGRVCTRHTLPQVLLSPAHWICAHAASIPIVIAVVLIMTSGI